MKITNVPFVRLLGFFLLWVTSLNAQGGGGLIILNHADSLVGLEINGERARQLIGNVSFTHGKTLVTCNRAIQFLQSNKATLDGEVIVKEDSLTMQAFHGIYYGKEHTMEASGHVRLDDGKVVLWADSGTYFMDEKKAYFSSNVIVQDTSSVLKSDRLTYFREDQKSIADGNVTIHSPENHITISGNHFENFRKLKFSRMTEHPKSVHVDSTSNGNLDTLTVVSDTMETYQDSLARLIAYGNVKTTRSDIRSEGGHIIFFTKLDSMELRRSPFVWYTQEGATTQASGDSMFIKLNKRRLQTLFVLGHAFTISEADTVQRIRYHQMSGQDITMNFLENKISRIDVDKTATIVYYLYDEYNPNGLNNTTGDHITISFDDGKIGQLKVTGGIEGKYVPERLVKGREKEYNLTGFNWKPNHNKIQ